MALSRKQKRKLKRLRRDADRLWSEQQAVFDKARSLAGTAGEHARNYAEHEVFPQVSRVYDHNVRPTFEKGVDAGRHFVGSASETLGKTLVPAVAGAAGAASGAVREFFDSNKQVKQFASRAEHLQKDASKRLASFQSDMDKQLKRTKNDLLPQKKKSGPGVGGWFLIGSAVAAVGAVGYALWQTFRADDDLWIADEELDAPVTTITPSNNAAAAGTSNSGTSNSGTSNSGTSNSGTPTPASMNNSTPPSTPAH